MLPGLTTVGRRARGVGATVTTQYPSRSRPLADPPAGSGLRPVMGSFGPPVVGHSLEMLEDIDGFARRQAAEHGLVHWSGLFGRRVVVATGPEAIGEIFANKDRAFVNGPAWGYFLGPFFTRGVMLLDFEEHIAHRRILQEAFTRDRLVGYLDQLNGGIERGLDSWQPGRDFRLYDATKELLLDLATEVFVGAELGPDMDRLNEAFVDTVAAGLALVRADIPGGAWHRGLRGRRALEDYFRSQIPTKRAGDGTDLFSVLCRAETPDGERFSDDDVVNHMIFTLMAAHDTSTITTATLAWHLAKHPEWQQKLREESEALGQRHLDYDDLERLPLLDQAFKEALRLNPPVGVVARQAIVDTSIQGQHVPAGTMIAVFLQASHRLGEWWEHPDEFDPGRFSEERREDNGHRFQWAPFGGGAHKCIGMYVGGMQVKTILHQLLLDFHWSVPDGYEPTWEYGTGLYPADGLPVRLERLDG